MARALDHSTPRLLLAATLMAAALAASAAGPQAYVGNFKDNTVSVIDTGTGTVVATLPVASGPHGMTQTPDGRTVYISGENSTEVSVIDTATNRVTRTIDVGKTPHGLAMTPDGRTLLVGVYGDDRVAFVDTASNAVVGSVSVAKPHTIAVRPDGQAAYVASQEPGKFALVVVDLAARSVLRTVTLDKPPRDPEFSADGRALYFTLAGINAVQVLDPTSDKIVAQIPTGASPHIAARFRDASVGTVVVRAGRTASVRSRDECAAALGRGGQTAALDGGDAGRQESVRHERRLERRHGSRSPHGRDHDDSGRQRPAQGRRPACRGESGSGSCRFDREFRVRTRGRHIAAGATVTWSNDDGAPHGLAYKDGTKGTDVLLPGQKFSRTYDKPGTYDYVCRCIRT